MINILGIRHHGVGSAQNVLEALERLKPDMILVESPPELDDITKWIGNKQLKPPVAVLGYNQENPKQAVFYPYSEFSPEWQAITFANEKGIPVRMIDLPLSIGFQIDQNKIAEQEAQSSQATDEQSPEAETQLSQETALEPDSAPDDVELPAIMHYDPISHFARLDGQEDSEAWWEQKFEQKYNKQTVTGHFEAVMLMMESLRNSDVFSESNESVRQNDIREAYMRTLIRKAQNELYSNIVIICGAWHAPALVELERSAKEDAKTLKSLPKTKIKVNTTLIPWTNGRLSFQSGYGAGITSPGWYEHIWKYPTDNGVRWLTNVAKLFRSKKIDVSTAHVIETYRLAESLAALRGQAKIGLQEHQEAIRTVMCMGDSILLELVKEELIVGKRMGKVPADIPKIPLQANFEEISAKLRLKLDAEAQEYELDLRKDNDLKKSVFLNRVSVLDIDWGRQTYARSKGTFKEAWRLRWKPEMMIKLIEMGIHGNTVELAASGYVLQEAADTKSITKIAELIQKSIPAELFVVIEKLLHKLDELATVSADIVELMTALVPLIDVSRYGNVRRTDVSTIQKLVEGLITRIAIGLPNTCYGTDDNASQALFEHIKKVNDAVRLLENKALADVWYQTLLKILDKEGVNALITGCTCRLLFDAKVLDDIETAKKFGQALSNGYSSEHSAGFVEGFLKGSGMILLFDNVLWSILYKWIAELEEEHFTELLPILRRTFSKFEPAERRQLGEKAKADILTVSAPSSMTDEVTEAFDIERAKSILPSVKLLLGI